MSVITDIRNAITLLTALPAGSAEEPPGPGAVAYFPWIGMVFGAFGAGVLALAEWATWTYGNGTLGSIGGPVLGVIVVGAWAAATRLLHWDGLGDVGDALWGGHTPERRLEIMSDSAIGSFGATVIAIVVVAQVASIGAIAGAAGSPAYVFAAPAFGRVAALFAAWLGKPAKQDGLGKTVMGTPGYGAILVGAFGATVTTAVLAAFTGIPGVILTAVALLSAAAIPHLLAGKMGGVTGDVMGASVLLTETILLVAAALIVAW